MWKISWVAVGLLLMIDTVVCAEKNDAENWSRWRGPVATGASAGGSYPVRWNANDHLAWKIELPGRGCSTPIVWGERILVSTAIGESNGLLALDWSGKTLWRTTLGEQRQGKHRNGSGANPSPVTDGELIFVYYKSGSLACVDFQGKTLWKTNLQDRFGKDTLYWDLGTSPVLTAAHVVVAVMHQGESFLAAFDKSTGQMAWKTARNYDCPVEGDHSYATPTVITHQGKQAILTWGAEHITAHDAKNGELLWSCGGFNPDRRRNWVAVASSVVVGDMVIVPYGRGSRLAGIKLGGSGDVTRTHRVWTRDDTGAFVPTPAAHDGKVFVLKDRGEVECLDAQTGKTLWSGALPKNKLKYYASPTIADGKMYAAREDGVVFVAKASEGLELLSKNKMGEQIIASPVAVRNHLLLRGPKHLFCVGSP